MRCAAGNIACLLTALVLMSPAAWSTGTAGIDVRPAGSSRFVLQPGKILTTGLHVSNKTDSSLTVNASLRLPDGWRAVLFEPRYALGPRTSDFRIISIQVPASTPAGAYAVRYHAGTDSAEACEAMLVVAVAEVKLLTLELADVPTYAVTGEPSRAGALLVNRGNRTRAVRLTARPQSWVTIDSSLVYLAPGETRQVKLALSPPADTSVSGQILSVTAELADDSTTRVQSSAWLKMLSRRGDDDEQIVRLPLAVRIRAAGQNNRSGLQLEVAGASPLIGATDYLDFLLRTPDIQRQSSLGYHDEYRASYRNGPYKVYFGDRAYALSSLTEYGRYAFGLGGEADVGDATVGVFVNRNRFYPVRQEEQALFARYRLPSSTLLGFNYLRSMEYQQGRAVTLQGATELHPLAAADVEYGIGSLAGQRDDAVSLKLSGRDSWGSYDLRYLRGGPHYPGYYRDMSFASGSFIVYPAEAFRLEGYVREEQRNLLKDPSRFYAPHNRYFQIGAAYGEHIAVHYRSNRQNDALPIARYSTAEDLIMIRSAFIVSRVNLYGTAELGTTRDLLLNASGPYRRYTLFTGIAPFEGQTYGLSLEYTTDRNLFVNETQHRVAGGLSAFIRLGSRTYFNLSLYGNRTTALPAQTYSSIDGMIEHELPWGHLLTVRGRQNFYTPSSDGRDRAFLVEYAVPVSIRMRRTGTAATLSGQVIDTQTGRGLPDVLLYVGNVATATDVDGKFIFPAVTPDTLLLTPDLSKKGIDLIIEEQIPLEIVTRGGETTDITLHVTHSAKVTGTINLFDFEDPMLLDSTDAVLVNRGGFGGAIVELARGGEVHRRVSDNRGRFSFTGLRPGLWTMHVANANLPEYHYTESTLDTIHVGPGTTIDVGLRILPRQRYIQMMDNETGSILTPGSTNGSDRISSGNGKRLDVPMTSKSAPRKPAKH